MELLWPAGYSARFDPALELLDEHGRVIGREGDPIVGGCPTAPLPSLVWVQSTDVQAADQQAGR